MVVVVVVVPEKWLICSARVCKLPRLSVPFLALFFAKIMKQLARLPT